MRFVLLAILSSLPVFASAAPKKRATPAPAARAVPAKPAVPSQNSAPAAALISSDLGGRDMVFLEQAIDLGKALRYLAAQASRTSNSTLLGFADDLARTLAAQSAILNTLAEMRKISVSDTQSASEVALSNKITTLEGAKLEKAILDGFIEIDRQVILTYELGASSQDPTIRKFVEQTLPKARKHLEVIESMAGVAPTRPKAPNPPPPAQGQPIAPSVPAPGSATPGTPPDPTAVPGSKDKPSFRTSIKPPADPPKPR
jgi:predicted outer membrane protein